MGGKVKRIVTRYTTVSTNEKLGSIGCYGTNTKIISSEEKHLPSGREEMPGDTKKPGKGNLTF